MKKSVALEVMPRGQFPVAYDSLHDRLAALAVRNDNLNEELCKRLEKLCDLKEEAIARADNMITAEENLLGEHLRD